ncbi:MAG: hypothetical protein AABX11_06655 [Nanoarchaeota archaeon]
MAQQNTRKKVMNQFFEVKAPLTSAKISLYGASMQAIAGRRVRIDLSRNLRGKNLELCMKVKIEGEGLVAEPFALNLFSSYIRRMMRSGSDYVEDSFKASCKDEDYVVKPFFLTRKKVSRAIRAAIRDGARDYLTAYMTSRTGIELFSDIISGKIQRELSLKLKKVYPLAFCDIRIFERVESKK